MSEEFPPTEAVRASHDPLTGVAGHELLVRYAFQALSRATRQGWVTGVFVIDIDDFSGINEAFGHDAGDQVLVELAARLLKDLRGSDEVARPQEAHEARADGVGRFGADRFVVVCENIVDTDVATSLAARIASLAAEPVVLHGGSEITITLGIGVGIGGPAGPGVGRRILEAEAALRTAKQRGQAQCEVLSEDVTLRRHNREDEEQALNGVDRRHTPLDEETLWSGQSQSEVRAPGVSVLSMAPVLLAEDDEVHACIVEASLANARLANPVVRARTGDEAAAYLATVNGGENPLPALVLLDLELPGQSGLCVLETLRGLGGDAGRCPVIMMSGSSDGATIARSRELGVRGYLVKPVAFDALVDVIHGLDLPWAILGGHDG